MSRKLRLGFIGANIKSKWASASHFPALRAHLDVELTAVCTTRPESAEEARRALGARLAFSNYREMVASPEIDAVIVVVRVPSHYGPAKAAIEAGKPVFVEWPLGRATTEAEELAALARAKDVRTVVGLQSRLSPPLLHMKELVATGYVGEVLACKVTCLRAGEDGGLKFERHSSRTWFRDAEMGANPLTIATGHVLDALRFVVGDFTRLGGMATTQVKQWYETDTKRMVGVTSPDNVLLNLVLANGAVASVQVAYVPWAPSGYRMEIYGREGTLVVSSRISSQLGEMPRLQGAQRNQKLQDLEIPAHYTQVPADFPSGSPFNVGQMYALFAQAVLTGRSTISLPSFDTAVELHRLIDTIRQATATKRMHATGART